MSLSLEAYRTILPSLPAKRAKVLADIVSQGERGATLAELVGITGWSINRLSGRVSELVKAGFLREAGKRGGQTVWAACLPHEVTAAPGGPRRIKGLVETFEEPDLFGRRRILVSIPGDVSLENLKTITIQEPYPSWTPSSPPRRPAHVRAAPPTATAPAASNP
jgi:hypothetical protein